MQDHFIHYLPRKIEPLSAVIDNDLFYAEEQNPDDGFDRPLYHMTRRKSGPATKIKKGSIIWLFSSVTSPWGNLPPSLDAKFVVEKVEHLSGNRTKFHANKKSKWFPLSDASEILKKLKTVDAGGEEQKLWTDPSKHIGIYLQSIRQLSGDNELIQWSDNTLNSDFHFISYRIKDGTKAAFQKTKGLLGNGNIVFWDRFSLPRRLAERREFVDDNILDKYLMKKLSNAVCVWGIESPKYSELNSYSLKEAALAKKLETYTPVQLI